MPARRFSLAQVMILIALVAFNLALWRGALLGLLVAMVIATSHDVILSNGQPVQGPYGIAARPALVASLMIVAGASGRSRLRSKGLSEPETATGPPAPAG